MLSSFFGRCATACGATVSANLALALAHEGARVGVLDADIYGPSQPKMLGASGQPVSADGKTMEPMESLGLQINSIGFMIEEDDPMIWRGPMAAGALQQLITQTNWHGDSAEVIGEYELVLITGKELEHVWEQNACKSPLIHEITIQFSPNLFGNNILEKNQFNSIRKMLEKAQRGISFPMSSILKVYHLLEKLVSEEQSFYAVINFLTILYELSIEEDYKVLASSSFAKITDIHSESRRIQKVQNYINERYQQDIRLNLLAELVGMAPSAFSRFFKLRTGKTLSDYITDIRIGYAARMLVDTQRSIAEICYDCGFNNLSNFNRIFKKKKNCSPKEFRDNYKKTKIIV